MQQPTADGFSQIDFQWCELGGVRRVRLAHEERFLQHFVGQVHLQAEDRR